MVGWICRRLSAAEYCEDRQTGSIYSVWDLRDLAPAGEVGIEVPAHGLSQLPSGTMLPEEAELIAAHVAEKEERFWFKRPRD